MIRLSTTLTAPRPALVCFITAGDGDTAANLDALVAAGADVIELGMPKDAIILANLCCRGEKGILTVAEKLGVEM